MKKIIILLVVIILPSLWVSGCAAPPGTNRPAASVSPNISISTHTLTPKPAFTRTPLPTTTLITPFLTQAVITPTAASAGESLWLRITSPLDNAVVHTDTIWVTGEAPKWTVISINDEILLVDDTQLFGVEVKLEDGPNLIEIVASDIQGNEIPLVLIVNYEP